MISSSDSPCSLILTTSSNDGAGRRSGEAQPVVTASIANASAAIIEISKPPLSVNRCSILRWPGASIENERIESGCKIDNVKVVWFVGAILNILVPLTHIKNRGAQLRQTVRACQHMLNRHMLNRHTLNRRAIQHVLAALHYSEQSFL